MKLFPPREMVAGTYRTPREWLIHPREKHISASWQLRSTRCRWCGNQKAHPSCLRNVRWKSGSGFKRSMKVVKEEPLEWNITVQVPCDEDIGGKKIDISTLDMEDLCRV